MTHTKVIFVGNVFGGDDGIGPYLYNELKNHPDLATYELMELGVIGFDLLSYVDTDDNLIIIDAMHSHESHGEVILLEENEISNDFNLISQHDFGVEQTSAILRVYKPEIKNINIIGITVQNLKSFSNTLSDEILEKLPQIKKEVVTLIKDIAEKENC